MANLVTPEGTVVVLGRHHVRAVQGRHAGTWWRIDDLFLDGSEHMVRASRKHTVGREHRTFPPAIFGLIVREEITRMRAFLNRLHHTRQSVDEGLIMGTLALLPLAVFEAYHGGEVTREFLASILGG
jgi:hypothetical protein